MVFERLVASVLNRFLGGFIENLDTKQLSIGGQFEFHDLIIKRSVLDNLGLPVQAIYGRIDTFILKIPWTNLLGDFFVVEINGLNVVVAPNIQVKYDPEKEGQVEYDKKLAEVEKIEAAKKAAAEKDKPKGGLSFSEKLLTLAIRNIQINVKNIHLRYEDNTTVPGEPFSYGVTLSSFEIISTDANWKKSISCESVVKVFKLVSLEALAVYWNSHADAYANLKPPDLIAKMKAEIATKTFKPPGYDYILGPINANARIRINQKPELDTPIYSIPYLHLNITMEKLYVGINKTQYRDLIALLDSMNLQTKGIPYRKYRPDVPSYAGYAKDWWHFAITCVLEEEVKRKRRNWDWNHIKNHRNMCKEYRELYRKKCQKTASGKDLERITECEKQLDLFNIVIIRQKVELETQRLLQFEETNKRSWFGWAFESSADKERRTGAKAQVLKDFEVTMTSEEKESLYQALDYKENAAPATYPETYVDKSCVFHLRDLEIELKDTERVMFTELKGVKVRYDSRIGANAMLALVNIEEFLTYGLEQDGFVPELITSDIETVGNVLLEIKFEINPLDKTCDQRLHVDSQPLKIAYDAETINRSYNIFNVPQSLGMEDLSAAASTGFANVKEMSATGMQHIIDTHAHLDLKIFLRAPYILIPYGGKYTENENVLVINLGNFKIYSTERKKSAEVRRLHAEGASEQTILQTMMEYSYDQYKLELTGLQILMAQSSEDWKSCIKQTEVVPMHILAPVNLNICFYQALITDDPRLPLAKVTGELRSMHFTLSDARLFLVMALASSIKWPGEAPEPKPLSKDGKKASSMTLRYREMQETALRTKIILEEREKETKDPFIQFTTMDLKFLLGEVSVHLKHQDTVESQMSDVASFSVNLLRCELVQQTFNTSISLKLGSIGFEQFRTLGNVNIISTPVTDDGSGDQYLFAVKFIQVNKKSPEFHSKHKSCESCLELLFKKLGVTLHLEGLLEFMQYATNIQETMDEITTLHSTQSRPATTLDATTFKTQLSTITENVSFGTPLIHTDAKKTKRTSAVVETIKFKVCAELQELAVLFATDAELLSTISISGMKSVVIMKNSYTQVNAALKNINVIDLNPSNVHKNILTVVGNEAINARLVLYNLEPDEVDKNDISVDLSSGGLRITFLNWYVTRMLNFVGNFQAAKQKIIEASQAAADAAKQNMQDAYQKATRISLNIDLKAPDIIVPVCSTSYEALLLDLGRISLINSFLKLDITNNEGYSPIIDDLKMNLNDFKLSRITLNETGATAAECSMLDPITLKFTIKRNLSTSWYRAVPDIDIMGKINTISITVAEQDYRMTMELLAKNLSEGQSASPKSKPSKKMDKASVITDVTSVLVDEDKVQHEWTPKVNTFLRFTFIMDRFIINLCTGGAKSLTGESSSRSVKEGLARFSLEFLSIKGRILSDGSMTTSILLVNCLLDDTRKGREGKITRLIYRSAEDDDEDAKARYGSQVSIVPSRSMIDITFQMKDNDMFADLRVFSFTIIVSLDYLMKIAAFFQTTTETPPELLNLAQSESTAAKQKAQEVKPQNQMTINLKIEKPDIILVENMDSIDTNALILNSEIICKLRMSTDHQVISGTVKDLQLFTCCYNPERRAETKAHVLYPVSISLAGSTPEDKGLHLELLMTDMHIRVSPTTIELLSNVSAALTATDKENQQSEEAEKDYSDVWNERSFDDKDHWFLKPEIALDAIESLDSGSTTFTNSMGVVRPLEELCLFSLPVMLITIEAGVGNKTVPMLLMESSFKGTVRNWSTQMSVEASLTLQMGYFNSRLAIWEPLIEPVQVVRHNKLVFVPWELKLEVSMAEADDVQSPHLPGDCESQPAVMSIDVTSENSLELTVTKSCLEVLDNLGQAFASAISATPLKRSEAVAPYKLINDLGTAVTILLDRGTFALHKNEELATVVLENGTEVPLKSKAESGLNLHLAKSFASTQNISADEYLTIKVKNSDLPINLPLNRADKRYFSLNYRTNSNDYWGIICDVKVDEGVTVITLRSILQVYNHFNVPIEIYYMTVRGNELASITTIQPGAVVNVPMYAVYTPTNELFFTVAGYSVTTTPYVWKDLQTNLTVTKALKCEPKNRTGPPFILKAVGEMEQVFFETTTMHTMASTCYNIHLRPYVLLRNCLPYEITCCMEATAEYDERIIQPGDIEILPNVEPGKSELVIRLPNYLDKDWSTRSDIPVDAAEFSVWSFSSYDSQDRRILELGMHREDKHGTIEMTLYCPFWMINKTGLLVAYRASDEGMNIIHHPPHFKGPILFSFNARNFFGKKKASIKIASGDWSDKFSVDVAGSAGMIICKGTDSMIYQIAVHNQLTNNGLTKQVTFTPYYVIINNAPYAIECQEFDRPADPWITVEPKSCSAVWPKSDLDDKSLILRVAGTSETSSSFLYTESHTTLLKLKNKYGGISVDIQITEGGVYVNLADFGSGVAPALIVNHTKYAMNFWEKHSVQIRKIKSKHCLLYTWDNPSSDRVLVWEGGNKQELFNDLRRDDIGEYSVTKDYEVYWVSFLDGMQRILLFTEDRSIAQSAQAAKLFEVIQQEITVSIHGIGMSLVNNHNRQEIMYIAIASSGVIWECCKMGRSRFKPFNNKASTQLELAYQKYSLSPGTSEGRVVLENKYDVDFSTNLMVKPHKRKIRRTFQTGLWLNMKSSPSQFHFHAKVNRIQIDNQMYECIFPVILAPVPPPKSVAADSGIKPFVEVSIVQLLMKNSQIKQYKYFKVLVQEFHIKVDLGFINALFDTLKYKESTEEEIKKHFLQDKNLVNEELFSHVSNQALQEQKSFYDLLHFSPLKIHVSFSMAAGSTPGQSATTPGFMNVLLQGLGVTLTDLQDVVFKLAYFERDYTFLTQKQLVSEATSHYVGQTVKQLYVLVFGLDVIGNPYGLVVGIGKGVEDFFYEPFQGAIQGPGEFAEGLVLGVRSLFGHTVGGAAGAVSRITGAVGKGIAALTFDEDYQKRRREQINKKPATVHEGLARSGKGLVMGVVDGVTGVFTKPVSGAREEGVGGFFKGLGLGAVGLVTRPVAGVADFASGAMDTVKTLAENKEDANRIRPPRFIAADSVVKPYSRHEAEGSKYLSELEKGKYASTDVYVAHYIIIKDKEILILTNKRLAYITKNDVFGGWQVDWSYVWGDLLNPASVVPKGISIPTSKSKSFLRSADAGKIILINDPHLKEEICEKIESVRLFST